MKVFLVRALGGQWEDSWESDIIAVKTEERAKELVEEYQKEADEHHEEMMWYKENPDKVPDHFNDEWCSYDYEINDEDGEWLCSVGCKACGIEGYYPSDCYPVYEYEEIEMED